jgi:hypothetical protein
MENLVEDLKALFSKEIIWKAITDNGVDFEAEIDGFKCGLRINDFPDEPHYTIFFKGMQLDFDDAPKIWKIPPFNG